MKTETVVEATGADLTAVLANATEQLNAYYTNTDWHIATVNARPLVTTYGNPIPTMWIADVTGETDA